MRKKLGLQGKFVVFYHGAVGIGRGVVETIKGIDKMKDKYQDVVLFLLGDRGSAVSVCKSLILESGIKDKVMVKVINLFR